jgi:serine/threonine-protein kinase
MVARMACPGTAGWEELLNGSLPEKEQQALAEHLDDCPHCQDVLEGLTASSSCWQAAARSAAEHTPAAEPALRRVIEDLKEDPGETMDALPATTGLEASPQAKVEGVPFLGPPRRSGHLGSLGSYDVLKVIGRGGMGVVLKAFDPALDRFVAIKVLSPQWASTPAARQRFAREARAMAAVRHKHVVAVHAVEEVDGLPYLVMEYVPGVSLEQRLADGPPLELEDILLIGAETAAGLAAAHDQGLIHRDVKPANILLEKGTDQVKLSDFGLARAADDASLTQSGVIAGTPLYMAPEQARGEPLDHRADLFSLGSVLYVMCTGRPPFRARTTAAVLLRVIQDTPHSIGDLNSDVPAWLVEIIETLHAKDPAARLQSASKVAAILRQHLAHLRDPAQAPRPAPVGTRKRRSLRRWGFYAACGVTALLLVWGGLYLGGFGRDGGRTKQDASREAFPVVFENGKVSHFGPLYSFQVDYRFEGDEPGGEVRFFWIVRSGRRQLVEQPLTPDQVRDRHGTLRASVGVLAGFDGQIESCLVAEKKLPGRFDWQRETVSNTLILPP